MDLRPSLTSETATAGQTPLILVADDEAVSRHLLREALQQAGFKVLTASDGEEAWRVVLGQAPDLLVLDFEMPQLDGVELCRRLRASEREDLQALPVIMLTAHTDEAEEIHCLHAGANDFVTKPVSRDLLMARIRTQIRLRSMANELRQRKEELERWRAGQEADLAAARATQEVLVPKKLPKLAGWSVESAYQPVIEVGGDVFGWRPAGNGHWHFWLADATGHGAAAALLTALAAQLFRQACDSEHEPRAILRAVNQQLRNVFDGRAFMTACCALVDSQGVLTFAGAGHPPLLVRRKNGSVKTFGPHGTLLGLEGADQFTQSRMTLKPGDTAVMYSDGLFAFKRPDGERFTHEDLVATLHELTPGLAIFDRLLTTLKERSDGESCSDDIAAIALLRS